MVYNSLFVKYATNVGRATNTILNIPSFFLSNNIIYNPAKMIYIKIIKLRIER